ncbi:MAG: hypothetical protein EVA99_03045 [SAR86 cluster bacterium]|uniref:Uncharacterized protein n=1 Tax=SAR86 cluster bacterium TaxID=2030880 RepID=A0A520MRL3_9GAMM|nr:MAG: hypothetical protein EVA99_03045 [SAR86 cluster bacterium]
MSFSFNLKAQISDNFLLLYESYDKLNNIEEIIEKAENRILRKYGVSKEFILDKKIELQPTEHFIGYQIKKFNDLRLIELKFNKDSIEEFFVLNTVPFFSFKGKAKVFIAANDSFFNDSNLFIIDNKAFQNELLNAKILSELNQNITLEFEFLENFPSDSFSVNELIKKLDEDQKNDWFLMLVDRFGLESWSYSFPKSNNITIQNGFGFRNFLLDEAIAEVVQEGREVTKKTFTASFKPDLSIEEIEIIFNKLSESTDILNFRILKSNPQNIVLEYESYLGPEDAALFLSSMGASTRL